MSAQIHTMPGTTARELSVDRQPVPDLIAHLERLLKEAKSGELRALAGACLRVGGETGTFWERPPGGAGGHDLMAAICYLQQRYAQSMTDNSRPREPKED